MSGTLITIVDGNTTISPYTGEQASTAAAAAAIATAADRVQTGLDAVSTAADRVQTGLDRVATAADVVSSAAIVVDVSAALAAGTVSSLVGTRIYASKTALEADLVPADGEYALVVGDATAVNNDLYIKVGATTTGSWTGPLGFLAAASESANAASIDTGLVLPYISTPTDIFAQFAEDRYYDAGSSTTVLADWLTAVSGSITRGGSNHWYVDSAGVLTNGSANTLRQTFNPTTLAAKGALIEPAATQLWAYSQMPATTSGTAWRFTGAGIGALVGMNQTGPDGTTSAGTFTEDTSTGNHYSWYYYASGTVTSGSPYGYQFWLKANGRTKIKLRLDARTGVPGVSSGGFNSVTVDLTAGTVTSGWDIEEWPDGFFRISCTATATASGVAGFQYYLLDGTGSDSYTGDGTSGVIFGPIQFEAVAPSSYIQRLTTTAATRSADNLALTLPAGVADVTFTLADGTQSIASVSPGSYSFPTSLGQPVKQFITVDLSSVGTPVSSVAGRTGDVTIAQADVAGLTTASSPTFAGLTTSAAYASIGGLFYYQTTSFISIGEHSNNGLGAIVGTPRGIRMGWNSADNCVTFSNSIVIGPNAAASATSIATSGVYNDTAASVATTISGSEISGNEAGNNIASISASNLNGNFAMGSATGKAALRATVDGHQAMRFNGGTDTVAFGSFAGYGNGSAIGTHTNCVYLGSYAGDNMEGDRTGNILIGKSARGPTATTDNYLNLGDVFKGSMSAGTFTLTNSAGGAASLATAGWFKTGSYTVAGVPSASTAGAGAMIYVSNETGGGVLAFSDGTNWRRSTDRAVVS